VIGVVVTRSERPQPDRSDIEDTPDFGDDTGIRFLLGMAR